MQSYISQIRERHRGWVKYCYGLTAITTLASKAQVQFEQKLWNKLSFYARFIHTCNVRNLVELNILLTIMKSSLITGYTSSIMVTL
jgi:hypothetical protein